MGKGLFARVTAAGSALDNGVSREEDGIDDIAS